MTRCDGHIRSCEWFEVDRVEQILKECGLHYGVCDYGEALRSKLQHDPDSVLVIESGKRIVGTVFLFFDPFCSFLYQLAIDPVFQGKGFGSRLLDTAERRLRMRGTANIAAYVRAGNRRSLDMAKRRGYAVFPEKIICVNKPFVKRGASF